jgi:hypothetical protein
MLFLANNTDHAVRADARPFSGSVESFVAASMKFGHKASRALKHDHSIDCIYQIFRDALVVEVTIVNISENLAVANDQFFYIYSNGRLRCLGEEFWIEHHPWHSAILSFLASQSPNDRAKYPFYHDLILGGSRNNFTHMIVDHMPAYLLAIREGLSCHYPFYTGKQCELFNDVTAPIRSRCTFAEVPSNPHLVIHISADSELHVKVTKASRLHCYSFVSIHRCFLLLQSYFASFSLTAKGCMAHENVYLRRATNDRVANGRDVARMMADKGYEGFSGISCIPIFERLSYFQNVRSVVVPPGSDNLNALLFMPSANIFQMLSLPKMFAGRGFSRTFLFSGIRYLLPRLARVSFWSSSSFLGLNCGCWSRFEPISSVAKYLDVIL